MSLPSEKIANNTDSCSSDLNSHNESGSITTIESTKVMAGSTNETKPKTGDSDHVGEKQPPETLKSPSELPAEEKARLNGGTSDSAAVIKESAGFSALPE